MRRTAEDCLPLDANRLAKEGWFNDCAHPAGLITWSNGDRIGLHYRHETLHLNYILNGKPISQAIDVQRVPCHLGGVRYYFTCPGCQNRRYKLRSGRDGFYCRHCYRLPYYSQQCGDLDRLIHNKHKVDAKLTDKSRAAMRITTRMKLISRLFELEEKIDQEFVRRLGHHSML